MIMVCFSEKPSSSHTKTIICMAYNTDANVQKAQSKALYWNIFEISSEPRFGLIRVVFRFPNNLTNQAPTTMAPKTFRHISAGNTDHLYCILRMFSHQPLYPNCSISPSSPNKQTNFQTIFISMTFANRSMGFICEILNYPSLSCI